MILLVSCKPTLYTLDTSPLSEICVVNIFSQSVACLFVFIAMSFEEQFLILKKSKLSLFSFMANAFCVLSEKALPIPEL